MLYKDEMGSCYSKSALHPGEGPSFAFLLGQLKHPPAQISLAMDLPLPSCLDLNNFPKQLN